MITQARSFDELLANIRDAAMALIGLADLQIELVVPAAVRTKPPRASRKRKATAAR